MYAKINPAQAALRSWVLNLHKVIAGNGLYVCHIAISVPIFLRGLTPTPARMTSLPTIGISTSTGIRPSISSPAEGAARVTCAAAPVHGSAEMRPPSTRTVCPVT